MQELRERYFERLNNFRENSYFVTKDIICYRYGELYGLLDSMRILNIISFEEYLKLMNELNNIYNTLL